jgi:tetratricopeptide (TPR) repeat protein
VNTIQLLLDDDDVQRDDEIDIAIQSATRALDAPVDATVDEMARFLLLLRLSTLRLRAMCRVRRRPRVNADDVALRIALNTVLVVCTLLNDDVSPIKRSRLNQVMDSSSSSSDAVLLWRAVGAVLARRDVDVNVRSELVQFVCAYVFVQLMLASDVPAAIVQLTRDVADACDDNVRAECRHATLLVAAHVALATGAHDACVEMCTAALALSRRGAGNAFFVRGTARLALRQWLGAMADFDGAVRASYRFAASTLMREVSRMAAGGADWRAVAQAIGRAAEQHSDGSAASRADLDAATAMLNLALVFRAADRTDATATMLRLLGDACARGNAAGDVSAELTLTCRHGGSVDALAPPDGDLRLRSLCSVNAVGVQYLAAKATLLAGQFSSALNMYAQLATLCPLTSDAVVAPPPVPALPSVDVLQLHREWVYALVCTGDSKRALTLCNKLIKIVDDPVIGLHRADAMVMLGLSQAALAQLDEIEQRLAARADDGDAMRARLRSVVRNNRALLHVRLGELPAALKLMRLLVSAEPSNVTAAFNYCLLARSMGAAYEIEACVVWLEARQLPVLDDSLKFADLAARRRAALERLDPSDRSCVEAQLSVERAYDGAVSGAVTTRAALALDVSVLKRWCTLIADPRLQKRLAEARGRH